MTTESEIRRSVEAGKSAFESGHYESASQYFREAAQGYTALNDQLNVAEQMNNLSVALLEMGRAQEALDAAKGTDEIFARARDVRRQGIALNNQATALARLHRMEEALGAYEASARLLGEAGEGELRALALKAAAGIQLRQGRFTQSAIRMIGALEARERPSLFERVLKFLIRLVQR